MPIVKTMQDIQKHFSAKVFKGGRKPKGKYGAGSDLKDKLRIEPKSPTVRSHLNQYYPEAIETEDGDLLVSSLNIYAAYNTVEQTFDCWMRKWAAKNPLIKCDRHTIVEVAKEETDVFGNKRTVMSPCGLPCPMRGQSEGAECVQGCKQEGVLTFYIKELLDKEGNHLPAQLTTHSWEDIQGIPQALEFVQEEFGAVDFFQLNAQIIRIPLILSRIEVDIKRPQFDKESKNINVELNGQQYSANIKQRTGKANSTTWTLLITVDPHFRQEVQRRKWQLALGDRATPRLLKQVASIDDDFVLPPAPKQNTLPSVSTEQKRELWELGQKNGWTKEAIVSLLSEMGVTSIEAMNPEQLGYFRLSMGSAELATQYSNEF